MKRPLYYLFCAIACVSMVSATLPIAAIAEAMQPRATAEKQAQSDATSSDTGKTEDGADTNAAADTVDVEDSTAKSTDTRALRTYFVAVYFTGTPVNISELSGECGEGERARFGPRRRSGPC